MQRPDRVLPAEPGDDRQQRNCETREGPESDADQRDERADPERNDPGAERETSVESRPHECAAATRKRRAVGQRVGLVVGVLVGVVDARGDGEQRNRETREVVESDPDQRDDRAGDERSDPGTEREASGEPRPCERAAPARKRRVVG